ncbi:zinc finger protein ZFP2-like [Mytilus trossulus]|uniref:zinc finger protein ZFP2-like n=1 Tax=Mytilus trossulus TaxID=6551 RepID=UPI003006E715
MPRRKKKSADVIRREDRERKRKKSCSTYEISNSCISTDTGKAFHQSEQLVTAKIKRMCRKTSETKDSFHQIENSLAVKRLNILLKDRESQRKLGIENWPEIQTNPIRQRNSDTRIKDSIAIIPQQNNESIKEEKLEEDVEMYIKTDAEDEQSNYVKGSNEFTQFNHPREQTRTHIRTHTGEMFHNCDLCGKEFLNRYDLQIHRRSHTGFKPFKCLICGEEFSVKSSFILHTRRHQGKKYKSLDLKMHITTHAVDEESDYDGCSNEFSQFNQPQEQTRMLPILKTGEMFHNCDICGKEFCSKDDFQKHKRIHTGFKPFKCLICAEDFSVISNFKIHMKRHKEKENNSSGDKGNNPSNLQMHIRTHPEDEQTNNYVEYSNEFSQFDHSQKQTRMLPILKTEEMFPECDLCGKEFLNKYDLQIHRRSHTGFKPFKCLICGEDFSVISNFKIHMKRHKEKENNSSENKGDNSSGYKGNNSFGHKGDNPSGHKGDNSSEYERNNSLGHKGNNSSGDKGDNPSGEKANNSSGHTGNNSPGHKRNNPSDLQMNISTHAEDDQSSDGECSNEFSQVDHPHGQRKMLITHTKTHPITHIRTHPITHIRTITRTHPLLKTGELFHDCDICGKEFISKSSLRDHIRSHTGFKPYKCGICGRDFRVKSSINSHMKIHERKPYRCDVCRKGFTSSQALDKHIRTHTGGDNKPYTCDVCGNSFSSSQALDKHMRIHTGD